ncbi:hypothetical protein ACS5NO_10005 [Larkinella sp. GY13]|uniref:hypothetical protein n=1 Tax=Larkinella sp. GY13 TaxID=3453720 RepID=UPI003EEE0D9A
MDIKIMELSSTKTFAIAKVLVLYFITFMPIESIAQLVYLKPTGGIQAVFSDITYGTSTNSNLSKGWNPSDDYWGLLIQYNFIPKWRVSTGICESDIGWIYKIKGNRYTVGSGTYAPIIQFPLNIDYMLRDNIRIGRLDKVDYRYLMIFNVYLTGGASFNWFKFDNYGAGSLSGGTGGFQNPIEIDEKLPNVLHRRGASIQAGIGFQFKSHDKDRLDIQLVYSQGLRKLVTVDVDYTINQTAYFLQMAARGSAFRITASYPIRLSKHRKSEE